MTNPQPSLIEFNRLRKSMLKKEGWTRPSQSTPWRRPCTRYLMSITHSITLVARSLTLLVIACKLRQTQIFISMLNWSWGSRILILQSSVVCKFLFQFFQWTLLSLVSDIILSYACTSLDLDSFFRIAKRPKSLMFDRMQLWPLWGSMHQYMQMPKWSHLSSCCRCLHMHHWIHRHIL